MSAEHVQSSSWNFAVSVPWTTAQQKIPFYDFARVLPSLQSEELMAFANPGALIRAMRWFYNKGRRLLPANLETMRSYGWQPEHARIGGEDWYGGTIPEINLRDWSAFCCQLLAAEAGAWFSIFERNPLYCTVNGPEFTAKMCPYGTTYALTLSVSDGVFVEVVGAKSEILNHVFGDVILDVARKELNRVVGRSRARLREYAAVREMAAAAFERARK